MGEAVQPLFDAIPSFLGAPVGDLEEFSPGQVALAGYFCDNLGRPEAGQRYLVRQLRYISRPGDMPMNPLDLGDAKVFSLEPDKHTATVVSQCKSVLRRGARLVLIGGDISGARRLSPLRSKSPTRMFRRCRQQGAITPLAHPPSSLVWTWKSWRATGCRGHGICRG